MIKRWIRFHHAGKSQFGTLDGEAITVYAGDMFAAAWPTGLGLELREVKLLMPVQPSKVIALWNNFGELAAKLGLQRPTTPLYLIKSPNGYLDPGEAIRAPHGNQKIVYEGELGVVIGRRCKEASVVDAMSHVFGYTCANDVTAADVLNADSSFAQWVRAKGFDTFCPLGPTVTTGLDPATLRVRTTLNGQLRQDFPINDMRFSVAELVSAISHDMTLHPGDVILCGTSVGVGSMRAGSAVEVEIAGIGTLRNRFVAAEATDTRELACESASSSPVEI